VVEARHGRGLEGQALPIENREANLKRCDKPDPFSAKQLHAVRQNRDHKLRKRDVPIFPGTEIFFFCRLIELSLRKNHS
jgi:hypothetical protein